MSKHRLKFYPVGNGDTTLITLNEEKHILWDYANLTDPKNDEDKRCNLPEELNKDVEEDYEVVVFTHGDRDHINGLSDYFFLEHAQKYQEGDRKKINELWVPASVLIDDQAEAEAMVLKAEARYRLRNRSGILVFSRPKRMKEWCDQQEDISYDDVKHLFVDAGKPVHRFVKEVDGVEFFVHAPFYSETQNIDRNGSSIVVQAVFNDSCETKVILGSDCTHPVWNDIVTITRHFKRDWRLEWDFFHISHHCSYLALSDEKGEDKTEPSREIKWLFENQGHRKARLISSSLPIPQKGGKDDNALPPHRQAAAYYRDVAENKLGEFIVTMETPSISDPRPILLEIEHEGCGKIQKQLITGAAFVTQKKPPRAGV